MSSALDVLELRARQLYAIAISARKKATAADGVRPVALDKWNELGPDERELFRRRTQLAIAGEERLNVGGGALI